MKGSKLFLVLLGWVLIAYLALVVSIIIASEAYAWISEARSVI